RRTDVVRLRSGSRPESTDRALRALLTGPARRVRRRRTGAWVAALLVVALVVAGLSWRFAGQPVGNPVIPPQTVGMIDMASGGFLGAVHVGAQPSALVVDGDTTWVANTGDDTVSKVSRSSGS